MAGRKLTEEEMMAEAAASDSPADTIARALLGGDYFPADPRDAVDKEE